MTENEATAIKPPRRRTAPVSYSGAVGVLDLLLSRAKKVVIIGILSFFLGPTILVGFLVWRMVDREDQAIAQIVNAISVHSNQSGDQLSLIQATLVNFISAQRDIENQRNALMFEMCLEIANDGPGRARCRQAIGR